MSWNNQSAGGLRAVGELRLAGSASPGFRGQGVRLCVHESTMSAVLELSEPLARGEAVIRVQALNGTGATAWATWVDETHVRVTASIASIAVSVHVMRVNMQGGITVAQIPGDGGGGGGPPPSVWWDRYPNLYPELLPAGMEPDTLDPPEPPDVDPTGSYTSVTTAAELTTAAANPGTRIRVAASFAGAATLNADDLLVQFEPGVKMTGQMLIGSTAQRSHIEIDGTVDDASVTPAQRGQITSVVNGQATINFYTAEYSDNIVFRRLNLFNGGTPSAANFELRCTRSGFVQNRMKGPGWGFHSNTNSADAYEQLYFCGNNVLTTSATTNGANRRLGDGGRPPEDQSKLIQFQEDMLVTGATYECVRFNSCTQVWVNQCRLRERGIRFGNVPVPPDELGSAWFTGNHVYLPASTPTFFFPNVESGSAINLDELTFTGNTFHSPFSEAAFLAVVGTAKPGQVWVAVPNVFLPYAGQPAWSADVGDPNLLAA